MTSRSEPVDRAAYWAQAPEEMIRDAAINAFGEPNRAYSNSKDLRFGQRGSKSVVLKGEKRGTYFDHEAQRGGYQSRAQPVLDRSAIECLLLPTPDIGENVPNGLFAGHCGRSLMQRN